MNTTTKLWWLCYKAIPLVFDNSLSYLEMLARLLEYVNNLKDALKELYEKVENLDEKVERYYNDLLNRLDELETTLRNYIDSELQNTKDELLETIEENNTAMNQKIQDFIDYINSLLGEVKDVCFNPTNGHYENVCKILQDLYTSMQIDAMTVGEFDSTNYITVDYFDDFGLTAQEFDLRSKLLLKDFWKNEVDDKLYEIGNLENLKTLSKNTLVDAINEVQDTTVNQSGNISNLITRMNTVETDITTMNENLPFFTETNGLESSSDYTFTGKLETSTFSINNATLFYQKLENNKVLLNGFIAGTFNVGVAEDWELEISSLEVDLPNSHTIDKMPIGVFYWNNGGSQDVIGSCPIGYKIVNNHIILTPMYTTYFSGSKRGIIIIPPIVINNYPN